MVKKIIKAKVKIGLLSSLFVWDMNQHYPQENCLTTIFKFQAFSTQNN